MLSLSNHQNFSNAIALRPGKEDAIHTSNLKLYNPTIGLTGHQGEIYTGKFSNEGYIYATAGHDKSILLWEVYEESCRNLTALHGHSNAILELAWSQDDSKLYTCSADKSVCIWDIYEAKRIKKLKGHESVVNCIGSTRRGPELIVSGGDDSQMILWDVRSKASSLVEKFKYQITSICFNDTGDQIFIGGIDNVIKIYDLKKKAVVSSLIGHTDTVTGLALSNDGNYLLSNSMDSSIRCWDITPYAQGSRCTKVFSGATHNFEKNLLRVCWSPDDSYVSAGSADRFVYVWNANSTKIERKFGGHLGSVNETSFNKLSNVIASCSSDKTAIIGEF